MKKTITLKKVEFNKPKKTKYDPQQLKKGMKVESEHTKNKKAQAVITKNHLDEDASYYKKISKAGKKKKKS